MRTASEEHERDAACAGVELCIDTPGMPVRLLGPPALLHLLRPWYRGFLLQSLRQRPLDLELRSVTQNELTASRDAAAPHSRSTGQELWLVGETYQGRISDSERSGRLLLLRGHEREAFGELYRLLYARLAVLYSELVMVHASGLLAKGRAFLFTGPSGRGKSTVAGLVPTARTLHDDQLYLRRWGESVEALAVPYMGQAGFVHDGPAAHPVAAALLLRQAPRPALLPVSPAQALAELLTMPLEALESDGSSIGPYYTRSMALLSRLVQQVPCYELHFTRTELPEQLLEMMHGRAAASG